jgi:hypothetical protein
MTREFVEEARYGQKTICRAPKHIRFSSRALAAGWRDASDGICRGVLYCIAINVGCSTLRMPIPMQQRSPATSPEPKKPRELALLAALSCQPLLSELFHLIERGLLSLPIISHRFRRVGLLGGRDFESRFGALRGGGIVFEGHTAQPLRLTPGSAVRVKTHK